MKQLILYILVLTSIALSAQNNKLTEKQRLSFDAYFFDGMNERLKANYDKSNEYFQQCLSIDDKNDVILFKIAQNYLDDNKAEQALIYIEKAQALNPKNKWYRKTYIEIQIALGTAQKDVVKMIKDFKPLAKNKYIINDLYRTLYYKNKPKVNYTIANTKKKNTNVLAQLIGENKFAQAAKAGEKQLESNPDDISAYYYTALAYFKQNKANQALDFLDMGIDFVLKQKDWRKKYYQLYINIYKSKGKTKKAKKFQQKLNKL